MSSSPSTGRLLGVLLLLLLAMGLIGPYVVLVPINAPPGGFLENAARIAGPVRLSVLALFVAGLIPLLIASAAWPEWRERTPRTALWLLALAGVNLALQVVENAHWLTMLSLSQSYASADPQAGGSFELLALAVRAGFKWAHYGHILVLVAWLFTLFLTLFRNRAIPQAMAALGMASGTLHIAGIPLPEFLGYRLASAAIYGLPLAALVLVTGSWLLWHGFRSSSPSPGSDGTKPA